MGIFEEFASVDGFGGGKELEVDDAAELGGQDGEEEAGSWEER